MENEEFYRIVVATYESLQQRKGSRFRSIKLTPDDLEAKVKFYSNSDFFKSLVEKLLPDYEASLRKEQMRATPENLDQSKPAEDERTTRIKEMYTTYNGNASKAHKETGYAVPEILRCWKDAGLEIRAGGRPRKESKTHTVGRRYFGVHAEQPTQNL